MQINKKSFAREAFRALAFFCVLLLAVSGFTSLFCFKYNEVIYSLETFYEQEENTVDVLIIGSSHAFENINTAVLYDDFGVASFNLGSSIQPMWNSYHYLVEALKTQSPSLVVLEGYTLSSFLLPGEYQDEGRLFKSVFGFRPSLNALANLRASVPEGEFWEYFFRFYRYHSRYDGDLGPQDYYPDQGMAIYADWKGYLPNHHHTVYAYPQAAGMAGTQALTAKTELYYLKIIELCQSRGIPLYIVITPFHITEQEQQQFNRAAEIAAEYGVPFIDYNQPAQLEALDFDFSRDMTLGNHLSVDANMRLTRHLGEMLTSAHAFVDRRGDPRYASWARSSAFYARDLTNHELSALTQIEDYLARVTADPDYTVVVSVTGYCADYFDQITALLAPLGVDDIYFDYAMNGTWAVRGGEVIRRYTPGMSHPYVQLDNSTVTFDSGFFPVADRKNVMLTEKGLNIVVYDHVTKAFVDSVWFDGICVF